MLTPAQIDKIISHLNYPVLEWSIQFITVRLTEVTTLSSSAEIRILEILTQLDLIETERNTLRSQAGIREDGTNLAATSGTLYFQGGIRNDLNAEYKYWQTSLAIATSLNVWNDALGNRVVRS
jgi:hypothetical protein